MRNKSNSSRQPARNVELIKGKKLVLKPKVPENFDTNLAPSKEGEGISVKHRSPPKAENPSIPAQGVLEVPMYVKHSKFPRCLLHRTVTLGDCKGRLVRVDRKKGTFTIREQHTGRTRKFKTAIVVSKFGSE